jgi:hypothetical protein
MLHRDAVASDGIHCIQNWEVANAAARLALVPTAEDIGKVCLQLDTLSFYVLVDDSPVTWGGLATKPSDLSITDAGSYFTVDDLESILQVLGKAYNSNTVIVAAGDETTGVTAGTAKTTFRWVGAFALSEIRASLTSAQASGAIFTVDVKKNGVTFFSTKITIDNTEKTSKAAATPAVLSVTSIADDDEITIDVTQIGDGTAKGLKIAFIGKVI